MCFNRRHNHADLQVLKGIKGSVDPRVSVCHSATIAANALMHAGTTVDTFLRENLDWLARATNWAKFSATASLGVIHRRAGLRALRRTRGRARLLGNAVRQCCPVAVEVYSTWKERARARRRFL